MLTYVTITSIYLAGFLFFYKILLQKETFYTLNRVMLAGCILVSFFMPFVNVPQRWSLREPKTAFAQIIPGGEHFDAQVPAIQQEPGALPSVSAAPESGGGMAAIGSWLIYLYWFGVAVFAINFLVQILTLLYRAYSRPVIRDGLYRIVELSGDKAPCSFGNNIFINPEKYDWETYNQILLHEKIHVEQGHSFDILLAELALVFQWFNPFAWMYRRELENNLEFLTDEKVLESAVEKSSYQMSLVKVSVPHFPLSITTNYNQLLLKKRVVMMNAKRSSVHHAWKYFFIFPLLVSIAILVNEPAVSAQLATTTVLPEPAGSGYIATDGTWFAKIKENKLSVQLKGDGDDLGAVNASVFALSEFKELPVNKSGTFSLARDAGALQFTGKFEGADGMGRYQFVPDKTYSAFLEEEGVSDVNDDRDLLTLFLVGVTRNYVTMLKQSGYHKSRKNDVIAMYALGVDKPYIQSIRNAGFPDITLSDLVSFKALKINDAYIRWLQGTGDRFSLPEQVITYRAHNRSDTIPGTSPLPVKNTNNAGINEVIHENVKTQSDPRALPPQLLGEAGSPKETTPGKPLPWKELPEQIDGVDVGYIRYVSSMGYARMNTEDLRAFKALNITKEYVKSFEPLGYTQIPMKEIISLRSLRITPAFVQSFIDAGYKNIPLSVIISFKSLHISPSTIEQYKKMGYDFITPAQVIDAQTTGTLPALKKTAN